jgi:tetratricopeptide (TPR) repeat protein
MTMRKLAMVMAAAAALLVGAGDALADPQYGGGMGGPGGRSGAGPGGEPSLQGGGSHDEKPDIAARKAYAAAVKTLNKAKAYAEQAQQETNADKKNKALGKANDAFFTALDQFTIALGNKGDMAEAWNGAGYAHLHIGAYGEALDDYNHELKLSPDDMDAVANRAEACLQLGRLDDVRLAYLDLFNHARDRADQLMRSMQRWLADRRTDSQGFKPAQLDAFQQWIEERLKLAGA